MFVTEITAIFEYLILQAFVVMAIPFTLMLFFRIICHYTFALLDAVPKKKL